MSLAFNDYYRVGTGDEGAQTVELEHDEGGYHDKGKRVYCFYSSMCITVFISLYSYKFFFIFL